MTPMTSQDVDKLITQRVRSSWGRQLSDLVEKDQVSGSLSELHRLINALDANDDAILSSWKTIITRCQSHPSEVVSLDRRGRTCLLSACAKNPPLDVVETMLSQSRHGADALRDKTGYTAMATAILNHASLEVVRMLSKRPSLMITTDHHGNTSLHLACQNRYRHGAVELVALLLEACSSLAGRENSAGKTPLHVAIECRAPLDIVRMLVKASPESVVNNSCSQTPLIYAIRDSALQTCRLLVEVNPQVTHIRDQFGKLPLRCAFGNKFRDSKLVELLCTSKEAVLDADCIQRNALHLALERNVNPCLVETLLRQAPQAARAFSGSALQRCYNKYVQAQLKDYPLPREVDKCWTVLRMVLRAHEYESKSFSMLHAALATNAPVQVIQRILVESPEEARQMNAKGRHPLAIACGMSAGVETKDDIINLILDVDSSVAMIEDEQGRSILSIVAEHSGVSTSLIERIIRSNPPAVMRLDPKYKLYPFLIAALSKPQEEDIIQVGAILELLLASPHLIKSCVA